MKRIPCFFILLALFTSCQKQLLFNSALGWYLIEIKASNDLACNGYAPDVTFLTGANEARQMLGSSINDIYAASGLPKVLYQPGTQLTVKIRKPESADAFCSTPGSLFKQVVITEVK